MAKRIFNDAFLSINGVDLSAHVRSVTLDYRADMPDGTTMGDTTRERIGGGLFDWSMSVEFFQDYAASQVDATLFSLVGTTFPVILRADKSDGVSPTNPNYSGTGILESYQPVGGTVGEPIMAPVTIQAAGTLSRLTA